MNARIPYIRALSLVMVVAGLAMLAAPLAHATKLKRQNLTQLISESHSIIAGTVTEVTDGVDARGVPYTEVTIAVGSVAKGEIDEESNYTFRQFGLLKPRTLPSGNQLLALTPEGFPKWHEGEFAVAFLYRPASKTGLQTTAGLAQGKLTLVNGHLVNEFNNAGLFEGVEVNPALLSENEQAMLSNYVGAADYEAFMTLVGRAVSENWIENGEMQ